MSDATGQSMLTTLIYRSRLHELVPFQEIEAMVATANLRNKLENVTGILLFNGLHFFQLLEGPEDRLRSIYKEICSDIRHYNVVELLCDYAPARRFGKFGMELFDLRKHAQTDVLQTILDKGTSIHQLSYNDRALEFLKTFVLATETSEYYEIPSTESWSFLAEDNSAHDAQLPLNTSSTFRLHPVVDPLARTVVSLELRKKFDENDIYTAPMHSTNIYQKNLADIKTALAMASAFQSYKRLVAVSLKPMTLVRVANSVDFLLKEIAVNKLVPEQVVVQFNEREAITQFDEFASAVKKLKATGIKIAIDNFGAGFAGLQLLAKFQPDWIKINRDLICQVHKSGPRQAIIHAIIQCCSSLEIRISADDIEVAEEWMWLESAGIEYFQGPLFLSCDTQKIQCIAWPEKIF